MISTRVRGTVVQLSASMLYNMMYNIDNCRSVKHSTQSEFIPARISAQMLPVNTIILLYLSTSVMIINYTRLHAELTLKENESLLSCYVVLFDANTVLK